MSQAKLTLSVICAGRHIKPGLGIIVASGTGHNTLPMKANKHARGQTGHAQSDQSARDQMLTTLVLTMPTQDNYERAT